MMGGSLILGLMILLLTLDSAVLYLLSNKACCE